MQIKSCDSLDSHNALIFVYWSKLRFVTIILKNIFTSRGRVLFRIGYYFVNVRIAMILCAHIFLNLINESL